MLGGDPGDEADRGSDGVVRGVRRSLQTTARCRETRGNREVWRDTVLTSDGAEVISGFAMPVELDLATGLGGTAGQRRSYEAPARSLECSLNGDLQRDLVKHSVWYSNSTFARARCVGHAD